MAKGKHPYEVYRQLKAEGVNVAVIYPIAGGYFGRRLARKTTRPESAKADHIHKLYERFGCLVPKCREVMEHIAEEGRIETLSAYDLPANFIGGNVLTDSVGWSTPRFILDDKSEVRKTFYTPQLIWAEVVGNRIIGLCLIPDAHPQYTQRALRILMKLHYSGVQIAEGDAFVIQLTNGETTDVSRLAPRYRRKAMEFLTKRYIRAKGIALTPSIISFSIKYINVYKWKCGVERISPNDLSGGSLHLSCDLVSARSREHIAVKGRRSNTVVLALPKRDLGAKGAEIQKRLKARAKKHYDEYSSDPIVRKRKRGNMRKWREENPEKYRKQAKKQNAAVRKRYKEDAEYRSRRLKKKREQYQKHKDEINAHQRERYKSDPAYREYKKEQQRLYHQRKRE